MPTTRPEQEPPLSEASARMMLTERGISRGPDDFRTAAQVILDLESGTTLDVEPPAPTSDPLDHLGLAY